MKKINYTSMLTIDKNEIKSIISLIITLNMRFIGII